MAQLNQSLYGIDAEAQPNQGNPVHCTGPPACIHHRDLKHFTTGFRQGIALLKATTVGVIPVVWSNPILLHTVQQTPSWHQRSAWLPPCTRYLCRRLSSHQPWPSQLCRYRPHLPVLLPTPAFTRRWRTSLFAFIVILRLTFCSRDVKCSHAKTSFSTTWSQQHSVKAVSISPQNTSQPCKGFRITQQIKDTLFITQPKARGPDSICMDWVVPLGYLHSKDYWPQHQGPVTCVLSQVYELK